MSENLMTLSKHLAAHAVEPKLSSVLEAIALAGKSIAAKVRRARIDDDVIGEAGATNIQGETQQKLDVLSDEIVLRCVQECGAVGVFGSEERDHALPIHFKADGGDYCVLVDPLDGSSNIDVAVSVGTIFSVLRNTEAGGEAAILQPGRQQVAAGYIVYGSSVLLVLTTGDGVDVFVLDPMLGDFVRVIVRLEMPPEKKIYSLNEAYVNDFDDGLKAYLEYAHAEGYASRYIGSMVGDVHRTLLKGGVFIYPATQKAPSGKLRLLYEANPMAFLVEQAGGAAIGAAGYGILDVVPEELHQRTPVILGSRKEVEQVTRHLG